ncbi:MAG TPA: 6-hydroxymethylpterin diphosphokinase MptE-like protein, partial [Hyphomonadaceae bacterium]|nr:6-hydroxymethylpterin diphosphokinase MptE-like protein [Hyphomonadaceae bacterium]
MQPQTITDEYAQLNRAMHEARDDYGVGGWRHAQKVLDLREELDCVTVLDWGCGKGALNQALGNPEWVSEYDPAIPGKDARPVMADLLVCTDVLEHIEPDLIDNVLTEIVRLTAKAAFLVIATRPASKLLPDGTNTHKIVENAEWWQAKLAEKFFILSAEADSSHVVALVTPVRPVKEIHGKSAVSNTIRFENAVRNCAVVKDRTLGTDMLPRHDGRICIVGFGPTLHETWRHLNVERRAFGAKIVSVSGAHGFLLGRGIVPDYHVDVDPREHKAFFTREPHPDIQYWIASCCHPSLIDNLIARGSRLALWHLLNSDEDMQISAPNGPDPDSLLVCGGSGVGARAIHLFYALGYRSFSLYGMDCSFAATGEQHAGAHSGKAQKEWNVRVGGRWFRSSATQIYMARSVMASCSMLERLSAEAGEPCIPGTSDHVEFFMHGDGLLQ